MPQKTFSKIWILIILAAIVAGGILTWLYFWVLQEENKVPEVKMLERKIDETTNWKTYRNDEYGFEIKYPKDAKVIEKKEDSVTLDLPTPTRSRLLKKEIIIMVRKEEYKESIDYYCSQAKPSAQLVSVNGINFCVPETHEEKLGIHWTHYFSYHTIHNGKWITLSLKLSYCLPTFLQDECSKLSKFDINQEEDFFKQIISTFEFLAKN
jgi:flagellar basal body-associated protein FliL